MINSDMINMHMLSIIVKLSEGPMQSTVATVPPELSNRVVVLLSDEMLKALDEWRWENRISSRGEAIRQLVEKGLERPPPNKEKSQK
jgi:Ribbon-helix-helix protein, copG family